ncbi:MAG: hypothetical protein E7075_01650 [Bacteroidales bacterium]|nr:hypothetical protein [Bacteroidales bacterium]
METKSQEIALKEKQQQFELACQRAGQLQLVNNVGAAFAAAEVVSLVREALSDEVMEKVFMPLMNTKIGFLTDRTGKARAGKQALQPYSVDIVRDCIIDATMYGLLTVGNQFNIIAERMYPTKEGYTHLLKKHITDAIYSTGFPVKQEKSAMDQEFVVIPAHAKYVIIRTGEEKELKMNVYLRKDSYSTVDQLRGKAERRLKKQIYENITGMDMGDADDENIAFEEVKAEVIESRVATEGNKTKLPEEKPAAPAAASATGTKPVGAQEQPEIFGQ